MRSEIRRHKKFLVSEAASTSVAPARFEHTFITIFIYLAHENNLHIIFLLFLFSL